MSRSIILDTDTGVDDALAICLTLSSPELSVRAITAVHGNVSVETSAANIQRTLDVLNLTERPPVAQGAAVPLFGETVYAGDVHGWDGFGGATRLRDADGSSRYPEPLVLIDPRPAVQLIHDTIRESTEPLTLVAVGPLTNVAHAIQTFPDRLRRLEQIVVMGGAFRRQGNASPVAEFNIFTDPLAAQIVFDFDVPVTIVPLDVTEQVMLSRQIVEQAADAPLGQFVRDIAVEYMDFGEQVENADGCFLHDPLAVAYLLDPTLFQCIERRVAVEIQGTACRGQTVADLREPPRFREPPNARIAVDVRAREALELFVSRVLGGSE